MTFVIGFFLIFLVNAFLFFRSEDQVFLIVAVTALILSINGIYHYNLQEEIRDWQKNTCLVLEQESLRALEPEEKERLLNLAK